MAIDPTILKRKPYLATPIKECGEALAPIPRSFALFAPHPYQVLGAPYGGASPWMLRTGVLKALQQVQERLARRHAGWKIKIFDAYRPNEVQAFMVEREFRLQAEAINLDPSQLSESDQEMLAPKVFRLWGTPSDNPATPPPHSTGAAIDLTLLDDKGNEVDMGSPIDENSDRSNPDYFKTLDPKAHANRNLLNALMQAEGFQRNPTEWWHFSQGDQSAVWLALQTNPDAEKTARYGRADLVK